MNEEPAACRGLFDSRHSNDQLTQPDQRRVSTHWVLVAPSTQVRSVTLGAARSSTITRSRGGSLVAAPTVAPTPAPTAAPTGPPTTAPVTAPVVAPAAAPVAGSCAPAAEGIINRAASAAAAIKLLRIVLLLPKWKLSGQRGGPPDRSWPSLASAGLLVLAGNLAMRLVVAFAAGVEQKSHQAGA